MWGKTLWGQRLLSHTGVFPGPSTSLEDEQLIPPIPQSGRVVISVAFSLSQIRGEVRRTRKGSKSSQSRIGEWMLPSHTTPWVHYIISDVYWGIYRKEEKHRINNILGARFWGDCGQLQGTNLHISRFLGFSRLRLFTRKWVMNYTSPVAVKPSKLIFLFIFFSIYQLGLSFRNRICAHCRNKHSQHLL